MSDVASLELCHTLFELSGWDDTVNIFVQIGEGNWVAVPKPHDKDYPNQDITAYDLGYLWRKLPPSIKVELAKRVFYEDTKEWSVDLTAWYGDSFYWTDDFSTAEDALASLLIRLIKDKEVDDVEKN